MDIHHIRGRVGANADNVENLMALCREDHEAAHAHAWSKEELEEKHREFAAKEGRAIK